MYYDYTFQPYKFIFKIEVTYNIVLLFLQILLYLIKLMGIILHLITSLTYEKKRIFSSLFIKSKQQKLRKAVIWILKPLLGRTYVNPLLLPQLYPAGTQR